MNFDWRTELCSGGLYYDMLVSESFEQFARKLASSAPILLLLDIARGRPDVAADLTAFTDELLAQPTTPGELSDAQVPLAAAAYVLSELSGSEAQAALTAIALRRDPELGWAPRAARLFLSRTSSITASSRTRPLVHVGALSLLGPTEPGLRIGGPDDTVDDASRVAIERIAA